MVQLPRFCATCSNELPVSCRDTKLYCYDCLMKRKRGRDQVRDKVRQNKKNETYWLSHEITRDSQGEHEVVKLYSDEKRETLIGERKIK